MTSRKIYLYVVIPKSLTTFVPMMTVPDFDTGWKVVGELKEMFPDERFSLVSGETKYKVKNYDHWLWKFQQS